MARRQGRTVEETAATRKNQDLTLKPRTQVKPAPDIEGTEPSKDAKCSMPTREGSARDKYGVSAFSGPRDVSRHIGPETDLHRGQFPQEADRAQVRLTPDTRYEF